MNILPKALAKGDSFVVLGSALQAIVSALVS